MLAQARSPACATCMPGHVARHNKLWCVYMPSYVSRSKCTSCMCVNKAFMLPSPAAVQALASCRMCPGEIVTLDECLRLCIACMHQTIFANFAITEFVPQIYATVMVSTSPPVRCTISIWLSLQLAGQGRVWPCKVSYAPNVSTAAGPSNLPPSL